MRFTEQSYKRAVNFLLTQVVYFSLDSGMDVLCGSVLYKCRFYSHTLAYGDVVEGMLMRSQPIQGVRDS